MRPCNVWLLDSPEMVLSYSLQGGRVIFITEDTDPRLEYIPNKLSAKILLPPYEVVEAELDGRLDEAEFLYNQYLSVMEPADYIGVMLAAAFQNVQVGLYFGPELRELKFPAMFINYLYNQKGLVVGYKDVQPYIDDRFIPMILSDLLGRNLMDIEGFMCNMPVGADIPPIIMPMIVSILRPPSSFIKNGDYNSYFKDLIKDIHEEGKYLYCPIISAEGDYR